MTSPGNRQKLDRLMTIQEVAEYLQVPVATIYRWRAVGKGPSGYKIGRYIRWRQSVVDSWIEAQADDWKDG